MDMCRCPECRTFHIYRVSQKSLHLIACSFKTHAIGSLSLLSVCDVGILWPKVEWIRMPLGMEVGLGQCNVVLDVDSASPTERGTAPPLFSSCLLWPNGRPSHLLLSSLWPPCVADADIIFLSCFFFLLSFFFLIA